jgi:hypothetical protein
MPVTMPNCSAYNWAERTWLPVDPTHQMAQRLPSSWTDSGGFSLVEVKTGAEVVIEDLDGNRLATWWDEPGGTVVHINHAMRDLVTPIKPEALQVVVNAVEFAGFVVFADRFESGDTTRWSASSP